MSEMTSAQRRVRLIELRHWKRKALERKKAFEKKIKRVNLEIAKQVYHLEKEGIQCRQKTKSNIR